MEAILFRDLKREREFPAFLQFDCLQATAVAI